MGQKTKGLVRNGEYAAISVLVDYPGVPKGCMAVGYDGDKYVTVCDGADDYFVKLGYVTNTDGTRLSRRQTTFLELLVSNNRAPSRKEVEAVIRKERTSRVRYVLLCRCKTKRQSFELNFKRKEKALRFMSSMIRDNPSVVGMFLEKDNESARSYSSSLIVSWSREGFVVYTARSRARSSMTDRTFKKFF